MRRGVIAHRVAAMRIDVRTHTQRLLRIGELTIDIAEHGRASTNLAHSIDHDAPAIAFDETAVADLTTGLRVERILAQLQRDPAILAAHCNHVGVDLHRCVTNELLLRTLVQHGPTARQHVGRYRAGIAIRARAPTLLLQRLLESRRVDDVAALTCDQFSEIEGEAECVVQLERIFARDDRVRALSAFDGRPFRVAQLRRNLIEALHAAAYRVEETLLLFTRRAHQMVTPLLDLGKMRTHHIDDASDDFHESGLAPAEQPRMTDSASQNAP